MKTPTRFLLPCFLLTLCAPVAAFQEPDPAPQSLLHEADLGGWVEMGQPGVYQVENGILEAVRPPGYPNWLRSEKEYRNFILELDYQMPGWCEAGVLLHAPLYGRLSQTGYKLHLRHNNLDEGVRSGGALYDIMRPLAFASEPAKSWNHLEITLNGERIRVKLNNSLIQDLNTALHPELQWRLDSGYIGFQDLGCAIRFRNIRLQELPGENPWRELFNGRDLDGWKVQGKATWNVEDGRIVARAGDGYLITQDSFSGFEFQTMVKTSPQANGGIFIRWGSENSRGYEAQIYNVADATNPTGSLYEVRPARELNAVDGEWFLMQIISDGPYAAVLVNGKKVSESDSMTKEDRGPIALQMHCDGQVEFLRPRIRSLH